MYEMPPTLAAMLDTPIIPFQPTLPKALPTIEGNVDYRDLRDQLLRMDELLLQSGLETQLLEARLQRWLRAHPQPGWPIAPYSSSSAIWANWAG